MKRVTFPVDPDCFIPEKHPMFGWMARFKNTDGEYQTIKVIHRRKKQARKAIQDMIRSLSQSTGYPWSSFHPQVVRVTISPQEVYGTREGVKLQ